MDFIIPVIVGVAALAIGLLIGYIIRKRTAEAEIGSAEAQAKKILEDAIKAAESKKKETLLEAKEEILSSKNEFDREVKERRAELTRQERRVTQKEETLDRKSEALEKKDEILAEKIKEADERVAETTALRDEQQKTLQKISGMTADQAKALLLNTLEEEIRHEKAMKLVQLEEQFKEDADEKAREVLSLAIQRCAADHVAEITVSAVQLPSEEMKGRIIGR